MNAEHGTPQHGPMTHARLREIRTEMNGDQRCWAPEAVARELLAEVDRLRTELEYEGSPDDWDDRPIPEDESIKAAHPTRTGRHELYAEALRLVGAKRSKFALVDLVNWLLYRLEEKDEEMRDRAIEAMGEDR